MSRYLGGLWLCVAALVLACGVRDAAAADKKPKVKPPKILDVKVIGLITAVGTDGKSITVAIPPAAKGQAAASKVVKLDDKTVVEYVGIDNQDDKKLTKGYSVTAVMGMNDVATVISVKKSGK